MFAALAVGMITGKSLREACRAAMRAVGVVGGRVSPWATIHVKSDLRKVADRVHGGVAT